MPSYIVYRDVQPAQSANAVAPLAFFPPLGSDELFDALRAKYPMLNTHSERVGQASLEFFLEEDLTATSTTPNLPHSATVSPWEPSLSSFCSEASTWSSPDAFGPATPSSSPPTYPLSRQQSRLTTNSLAPHAGSNPPELQAMTSVFSLANAVQPKQRVRRKMTENEKYDYRKRRLAKACDKCAKRKRKCTHNPEASQRATSSNATGSTAESTRPQDAQKLSASSQPPDLDSSQSSLESPMDFDAFSGSDPVSLFDDFDTGLSDMNLDDFLAPAQPHWPWSDASDWTLLDPIRENATFIYGEEPEGGLACSPRQRALFGDLDSFPDMCGDGLSQATEPVNSLADAAVEQHTRHRHDQGQNRQPSTHGVNERNSYVDPSLIVARGHDESVIIHRDQRHTRNRDETPLHNNAGTLANVVLSEQNGKSRSKLVTADARTASRSPSSSVLASNTARQNAIPDQARSGGAVPSQGDISPQLELQHLRRDRRRLLEADVFGSVEHQAQTPAPVSAGLGLNKAPGSSKGMLQQISRTHQKNNHSAGDRLSSLDLSTQLFMLKRRSLATTQGAGAGDGSIKLAGLTPRLQTIPRLQISPERALCAHAASVSDADAPFHTLHAAGQSSTPQNAASSYAHGVVYEERLSDHFRRRDHFGRLAGVVAHALQALATVACMLALLACVPIPAGSLSVVLLALVIPMGRGSACSLAPNPTERRTVSYDTGIPNGRRFRVQAAMYRAASSRPNQEAWWRAVHAR